MTGASSTKPPAVIGRERASFTGACAVPVLMPLCWPRTGSFSAGFCWAIPEFKSSVTQMACSSVARRTHLDWLDREDSIRSQVGSFNPKGIFAQSRRAGPTHGKEDSELFCADSNYSVKSGSAALLHGAIRAC